MNLTKTKNNSNVDKIWWELNKISKMTTFSNLNYSVENDDDLFLGGYWSCEINLDVSWNSKWFLHHNYYTGSFAEG